MTIDWRYTVEENLGILSVAGHLGPDAVHRFSGAIGWAWPAAPDRSSST